MNEFPTRHLQASGGRVLICSFRRQWGISAVAYVA